MPLRNFLTAVNGADSIFITAQRLDEIRFTGSNFRRFSVRICFAGDLCVRRTLSQLRARALVASLRSGLKDLLERDSGDMVRATLRIAPVRFAAQNRRGFCLGIRLVAQGESAEQAELRWGLALARLQQALLFRSRAFAATNRWMKCAKGFLLSFLGHEGTADARLRPLPPIPW